MNILILHGSSDLYGASKILLVTVNALARQGHQITVVLTEPGPLASLLQEEGVEVVFIRLGILRRKYKSFTGIINRIRTLRKAYKAIRKLIKEKKADLVYSNTTAVLAGAYAAKRSGTRHFWHVHEIIEQPAWLYRFLGRALNRYSDKVIVVSEAVKQSWQRYVDEHKIAVVYNGIDYSPYLEASDTLRKELRVADDTVIIGMIGRVHHWKGQGYFMQIAAELRRKYGHLHFVMIGDAFPGNEYLYNLLDDIRKKENLDPVLTDLGYRTDVPSLLQGFDILVLPSVLPDPFPTVILEAMASGKPVVATNHGGAKEMITPDITGILVPHDNPAIAAAMMEPLLLDQQKRKMMGDAGRKKVLSDYSRQAFEQRMIKIVE